MGGSCAITPTSTRPHPADPTSCGPSSIRTAPTPAYPSVIMDVMNAEQAKIAEEAGACAVMALERIPANIRRDGGVARMVRC